MNESSRWLLLYVYRLPRQVIAEHHRIPVDCPKHLRPDMRTVRGLERRGYLKEACTGLFYLTDAGRKAAAEHGEPK